MDLETLVTLQVKWSRKTFGPGYNPKRLIAHIQKELKEIEDAPLDVYEWIDVAILALDGAWRCLERQWGMQAQKGIPAAVCATLRDKLFKNVVDREWTVPSDPDQPVEHKR